MNRLTTLWIAVAILAIGLIYVATRTPALPAAVNAVPAITAVSSNAGRFQLLLANTPPTSGIVMFKIDTITGETWVFDTTSIKIANEDYIIKQSQADQDFYTREKVKQLNDSGFILKVPRHWEEVPTTPSGIEVTLKPREIDL